MKAIDRPFTKIINGTTQFVIPVFQRDYSWTETQCEQIWKDLLRIANDPTSRGHFMGSVVYVSTGALRGQWTSTFLFIPDHGRVHCSSPTFLCARGRQQRKVGREFLIRSDESRPNRFFELKC